MIGLSAVPNLISGIASYPGFASAARYASVLVLCLAVSAASGSFVGNAALQHLGTGKPSAAHKAVAMAEISVPDTPVVTVQRPLPAAAASANPAQPAAQQQQAAIEPAAPDAPPSAMLLPSTAAAEVLYVRRAVNVRSAPSRASATVGVLSAGQQVEVADRQDGWIRVVASTDATGWVYGTFLAPGPGASGTGVGEEVPQSRRVVVVPADTGTYAPLAAEPAAVAGSLAGE